MDFFERMEQPSLDRRTFFAGSAAATAVAGAGFALAVQPVQAQTMITTSAPRRSASM